MTFSATYLVYENLKTILHAVSLFPIDLDIVVVRASLRPVSWGVVLHQLPYAAIDYIFSRG